MSGNSFGTLFRVTTFGESHGPAVGVVIDGCPPRLPITVEEIQQELERRRPGQSAITTQRRESDTVEILSGVRDGVTLGTPISLLVRNSDQRSGDYDEMRTKFRPSHADYTYQAKFGVRAWEGGGRASARETIGRVAAGVLARKALAAAGAIEIDGVVPRHVTGALQVWRYRAAGDRYLQIEAGNGGVFMMAGQSVPRGMIDHLPSGDS